MKVLVIVENWPSRIDNLVDLFERVYRFLSYVEGVPINADVELVPANTLVDSIVDYARRWKPDLIVDLSYDFSLSPKLQTMMSSDPVMELIPWIIQNTPESIVVEEEDTRNQIELKLMNIFQYNYGRSPLN
jgi:nucleotide-binding universal stress UspA family protein